MKLKIFLLVLLTICTGPGLGAQQRKQLNRHNKQKRHVVTAAAPALEVFVSISQEAEFPGGTENLEKYLRKEIRYPALAREDGIEGIVTIRFLIDTSGDVTRAFIQKDIGADCGREALRVVQRMPRWKPYKFNGRNTPFVATLTTRFRLIR